MSETSYNIEFAKTGRSKCKKCKVSIEKGEIRLLVETGGDDMNVTASYHPVCFNMPRKLGKMTPLDFLENVVVDKSEGEILPGKLEELVAAIASKVKKSSGGEDDLLSKVKAAYEKQQDGNDEPPAKKPKNELSRSVELYGKHYKKTLEPLKDYLRFNMQVLKGTKPFVLFKVIDGEEHGRLGPCPLCHGALKFHESGKVECNGQFDEDIQFRIPCAYSTTQKDAPRLQPWYTEPPTKEQKDEMERLLKGEKMKAEVPEEDAKDLLAQAKAIPWDLSNKQGMRQAAASLIEIMKSSTQKIDLPSDDKAIMKKVGQSVMANKDKTASDVLKVLIHDYGYTEKKKAHADKKLAATKDAIVNPANAPLITAFQELRDLYFKEQNRNAGGSYAKVVKALCDVPFEINAANAPGLSKGKTKLQGVGKSSGDKIVEFIKTGTIQKLEEKRADNA